MYFILWRNHTKLFLEDIESDKNLIFMTDIKLYALWILICKVFLHENETLDFFCSFRTVRYYLKKPAANIHLQSEVLLVYSLFNEVHYFGLTIQNFILVNIDNMQGRNMLILVSKKRKDNYGHKCLETNFAPTLYSLIRAILKASAAFI